MHMALGHETMLRKDIQRVVETLHHEEISVRPYADQYRSLLDNHGKMIRASLVLVFARADASDPARDTLDERVITAAAAIEMLHLATLVHDDVLDGAPIRRNEPTVQTVLGNKTAIYLGDLILSRYMQIMADIAPDLAFIREQSSTLREIVTGELLQESVRHQTTTTVDHYMQAIGGKTAALFRLACLTGLRLTADPPEETWIRAASEFGDHLGTAFQIVDDIDDFDLSHDTGKPKLEDVSDGIYTLPVLLALREQPSFSHTLESDNPHAVLDYLCAHPETMKQSRDIALWHVQEARDALTTIPLSSGVKAMLTDMLERFSRTIH